MGHGARELAPSRLAKRDEILQVLWSDYYGAVFVGDWRKVVHIADAGCQLEVVATAATTHCEVACLRPGQVLRYHRSFFLFDRLTLPSGRKAGLWHFVGFKLRLASSVQPPAALTATEVGP